MPSYDLGRAHGQIQLAGPPEVRCIQCGCPNSDHIALRYALRAWLLHLLPARLSQLLRPLKKGHR